MRGKLEATSHKAIMSLFFSYGCLNFSSMKIGKMLKLGTQTKDLLDYDLKYLVSSNFVFLKEQQMFLLKNPLKVKFL